VSDSDGACGRYFICVVVIVFILLVVVEARRVGGLVLVVGGNGDGSFVGRGFDLIATDRSGSVALF